jgi:hypothetical protein
VPILSLVIDIPSYHSVCFVLVVVVRYFGDKGIFVKGGHWAVVYQVVEAREQQARLYGRFSGCVWMEGHRQYTMLQFLHIYLLLGLTHHPWYPSVLCRGALTLSCAIRSIRSPSVYVLILFRQVLPYFLFLSFNCHK